MGCRKIMKRPCVFFSGSTYRTSGSVLVGPDPVGAYINSLQSPNLRFGTETDPYSQHPPTGHQLRPVRAFSNPLEETCRVGCWRGWCSMLRVCFVGASSGFRKSTAEPSSVLQDPSENGVNDGERGPMQGCLAESEWRVSILPDSSPES